MLFTKFCKHLSLRSYIFITYLNHYSKNLGFAIVKLKALTTQFMTEILLTTKLMVSFFKKSFVLFVSTRRLNITISELRFIAKERNIVRF